MQEEGKQEERKKIPEENAEPRIKLTCWQPLLFLSLFCFFGHNLVTTEVSRGCHYVEIDRRSLPDRFLQLRDLDKSQKLKKWGFKILKKKSKFCPSVCLSVRLSVCLSVRLSGLAEHTPLAAFNLATEKVNE